jgi:hypothetical protein
MPKDLFQLTDSGKFANSSYILANLFYTNRLPHKLQSIRLPEGAPSHSARILPELHDLMPDFGGKIPAKRNSAQRLGQQVVDQSSELQSLPPGAEDRCP